MSTQTTQHDEKLDSDMGLLWIINVARFSSILLHCWCTPSFLWLCYNSLYVLCICREWYQEFLCSCQLYHILQGNHQSHLKSKMYHHITSPHIYTHSKGEFKITLLYYFHFLAELCFHWSFNEIIRFFIWYIAGHHLAQFLSVSHMLLSLDSD